MRSLITPREENAFIDQLRLVAPLKFIKAPLNIGRPFEHKVEAVLPSGLGKSVMETNHKSEVLRATQEAEDEPVSKTAFEFKLTSRFSTKGGKMTIKVGRKQVGSSRPTTAGPTHAKFHSPLSVTRDRSLTIRRVRDRTPDSSYAKQSPYPRTLSRLQGYSPVSKGITSQLVWSSAKASRSRFLFTSQTPDQPAKDPVTASDFYDGEYAKDQKEGNGKVVYSNGDEYTGSWRKNMRHGHGTYFYRALNLTYEGEWENNSKSGYGQMTFSNGDIMHSGWNDDEVSETKSASFAYKSGGAYEGMLRNGLRHGQGVMSYSCGAKYDGGWKDDCRDGVGIMWLPKGVNTPGVLRDTSPAHAKQSLGKQSKASTLRISSQVDPRPVAHPDLAAAKGGRFQGQFSADSTNGIGILTLTKSLPMPENPAFGDYNSDSDPDYTSLATYKGFVNEKIPLTSSIRSEVSSLSNFELNLDDVLWVTMTCEEVQLVLESKKKLLNGAFIAGKLQGAAYCKYGVYGTYQGAFKDGKRSGYGKMTYKDAEHQVPWFPETIGVYEGNWLNDERHGVGVMKWEKNISYEGQWRQDRRNNVEGKMVFENGDVYEGSWQDNSMHGNGVFRMKDGKEYRGRFRVGVLEPAGAIKYPSGDRYEGELFEMQPSGLGTMIFANGNVYEGLHEAGQRQGHGTMRFNDGSVYVGAWKHGQREGTGIMTYSLTGEMYKGAWSNDKRQGFGTLMNSAKEVIFSGSWREDMKEGQGKVAYTSSAMEYFDDE
jgi:hypothetical protein